MLPAVTKPLEPSSATTPAVMANMEERGDLAAITVASRVPEFWVDQPRLWFLQTEAILAPQRIGDETKFNLVVTKLSKEVIQQITDILTNPPETKKYDTIKERLLLIYEESEARQIQKLMREMELGDQRPSQLLRKMKELARDKLPDATLRILWQGHLPASVRGIMAVTESSDINVLARIADKVIETTESRTSQVSSIQPSTSSSSGRTSDMAGIIAEIQKLNERFDRLQTSHRSRAHLRGRSQNRSSSRSRNRSQQRPPNWLCFYHRKWQGKAVRCIPPCTWKNTSRAEN